MFDVLTAIGYVSMRWGDGEMRRKGDGVMKR